MYSRTSFCQLALHFITASHMARGRKTDSSPAGKPSPSPGKPVKQFFDRATRTHPAVAEAIPLASKQVISSESESHIESALSIYRREKARLAKSLAAQTSTAKSTRSSKRQKVTRETQVETDSLAGSQGLDRASGDAAGEHKLQ